MSMFQEIVSAFIVLGTIAAVVGGVGYYLWRRYKRQAISETLKRHFRPIAVNQLAISERQFPQHIRADLQRSIEEYLSATTVSGFSGVQTSASEMGGVEFSALLDDSLTNMMQTKIAPQYEEIDIGEDDPARVLMNGLWLIKRDQVNLAVLYAPMADFGDCGIARRMRVQVAVANDEQGTRLAQEFFKHLERGVLHAKCYRGKTLSFESDSSYFGQARGVKVHRLRKVSRDELVLPKTTVELLDRNVVQFIRHRAGLGQFKMATKKGLLFYGPPGTGKTHTIRYLAGELEQHTTFLISAEQVGALGEYMTLARLLQPSIVVIEDVDLIARERTRTHGVQTELLLNKLLNEMDGLKEDSDIIFILTTNRPEELEAALASRPGRIDQAIEFPLPDVEGRKKLAQLYARGLTVPDELVQEIADRTERVSASFIKELMRRAAQWHLERNGTHTLALEDVRRALEEMLSVGGSLNLKLLGAEGRVEVSN